MQTTTGKWGRIFIWGEYIEEQVHPEDVEFAMQLAEVDQTSSAANARDGKVIGDIVECIDETADFLTIQLSSDDLLRIRRTAFHELPFPPPFRIGDRVSAMSKGKNVFAEIALVCWHFKKEDYYFFISIDGRRRKKRYEAAEIQTAND